MPVNKTKENPYLQPLRDKYPTKESCTERIQDLLFIESDNLYSSATRADARVERKALNWIRAEYIAQSKPDTI